MGSMGVRSALLLLVALAAAAGCDDPKCTAQSDCDFGEICVEGLCHHGQIGNWRQRDAAFPVRPDTGVAPNDGDGGPDGGLPDQDGGGMDAGAPLDGGGMDGGVGPVMSRPTPLPVTGDLGFVWVAELYDSETTSAHRAFALLQNLDGVTYTTSLQRHQDAESTTCEIRTRRRSSGTPDAYEAQEISVIPGPQPFSPFSMYPVGDGRFEPAQDPVDRIFNESRFAVVQIFGNGNARSIDGAPRQVNAPPFPFEDPAFPRGSPIAIEPPPNPLRWTKSDLSQGDITIEVFDQPREVLLTCVVADDGAYTIPSAAVSDFRAATPTPPVYLEIRYDREARATETVEGGGSVSVTYRVSQGLRYPVTLP